MRCSSLFSVVMHRMFVVCRCRCLLFVVDSCCIVYDLFVCCCLVFVVCWLFCGRFKVALLYDVC